MNWSDIPWTPTRRQLRQFAGLWTVALMGLAARYGWREQHSGAGILLASLAAIGVLGLVKPPIIRPLFVGWMVLVFPVGWTVSRLVLGVLFYGIFTPLGFLFRLLGRDVLGRRWEADQATYWTPRPATADVKRYFRSF